MNKIFLLLSLICTLGFRQANSMESQSSPWPWDQTDISQQAAPRTTPAQAATRNTGSDRATSQTTRPDTTLSEGPSSGIPSKTNKTTLQPVTRCTNSGGAVTTTSTTCPQSNAFDWRPVEVLGGMTIPADSFGLIITKTWPLISDKIANLRLVSRTWNQTTRNALADYGTCEHDIDMTGWSNERIEALFVWAAAYPNLAGKVRTVRCDSKTEDHILSCIVALFPGLEQLNLHYCARLSTNGFMTTLGKLKNLRSLDVSFTEFDDASLINLAEKGPGLETLDLTRCWSLTQSGFMVLGQMKNLKSLNVHIPQFDDNALINLVDNVPDLENIDLSSCSQLTANGFTALAKLKKLKFLDVSYTQFNNAALINLADNVPDHLEQLNLCNCDQLTKNDFMTLGKLKNLRSLNVSSTWFDDAALINLANNVPDLENIDLSSCSQLTANGFTALAKLKKLKTLNVRNTQFDDAALINLANNVPDLEDIDLSSCSQLTANGFTALAKLKKLKFLDVSSTQFDNISLTNLAKDAQALEHLDLENCAQLITNGFMALARLKNLKSLTVKSTQFNDNALINLVKNVPGLRHLDLGYCRQLTTNDFMALEQLEKLKILGACGTCLGDVVLALLAENNPGLELVLACSSQITRRAANAARSARPNLIIIE